MYDVFDILEEGIWIDELNVKELAYMEDSVLLPSTLLTLQHMIQL